MRCVFLSLVVFVLSVSCTQKNVEVGSKDKPIQLFFTPSVDSDTITKNSKDLVKFLEKETGLFFEVAVPASYIAVVEAFGSQRADIAVMNSFGYLMAHEKYGAEAKLKVVRYGKDYYRGQILARADSGIKSVEDLAGKKFAYTDASSTSGYMFPKKLMKEASVKPGNTVFAIKHDNVVTMIYQGQVDAGATYYDDPKDGKIMDARARVLTQFPDVADKVKIIKVTDKIPNDPFVFRKGLSDEITKKFISGLKKFIADEEGVKKLKEIYNISSVSDAVDTDWNGLRDLVKSLGIDLEKKVK